MVKILIVDDESYTREGILETIPWEDLSITEVKEAFDGINALEILESYEPDIILTDVRMPRLNGIELSFKAREIYPNCSIIFMSGYSDKEYLKSAIHLKAISYVEKPIDLYELDVLLSSHYNLDNYTFLKNKFSVIVFLNLINSFDLDENLFISELEKIINIYNIKPLISFINKKQIILNLFLPKNDNSFINSNEFS